MAITPKEVTVTPPLEAESKSVRRTESPEAQMLIAYIEAQIDAALRREEGGAEVRVRKMIEAIKRQVVKTTRFSMDIEVPLFAQEGDRQWSDEILSKVPTGVKDILKEIYGRAGWARVFIVIYNTYDKEIFTGKRFEIGLTRIDEVVRTIG